MLVAGALILVAMYACGHWLAGASVGVLLLGWRLLASHEGPPVLALAFTYQWGQVTAGIFYRALTGETLPAFEDSDWETMVMIGLGCVTAIAVGVHLGIHVARAYWELPADAPQVAFSWRTLAIAYVVLVVVAGVVQQLAWEYPTLTQAILAIGFSRLALLFLIMRRLTRPEFQWKWIGGLLAFEILLGFTGFFAGFREPLMMGVIATIEVFDRHKKQHWAMAGALAVVMGVTSLLWMGVRTEYREDYQAELHAQSRSVRFERIRALSEGWIAQDTEQLRQNLSALVDRIWAIYYPALAIARVPSMLPHTDGTILSGALFHLVTPRILFPDKGELPSDSEMVRKYSGAYVAGTETETSIAFGYAAESYLDFGLPMMFVPVLVFGLVMGIVYHGLLVGIRHRDMAVALVTVISWLSLYLFERSWIKTFGLSLTLVVYLGGLTYLLDRWLMMRAEQANDEAAPHSDDPLYGGVNH
jgi:hypothetical protein